MHQTLPSNGNYKFLTGQRKSNVVVTCHWPQLDNKNGTITAKKLYI